MRVLLISDFSIEAHPGGAQISNDLVIKKGIELGYEVDLFHSESSPIQLLGNYDVIISSNLDYLSRSELFPLILDKILNHPMHVRYEHDSCLYLDPETRKKIFTSTKINFFLSQFHLDFFKNFYGNYFENIEIVYDPIDVDKFKITEIEKIYDTIYCGYAHQLKGFDNFINYAKRNKDKKLAFIGWFSDESFKNTSSSTKNIEFIGHIESDKVPDYLQKTKNIFHEPIVNEPFCRMVAESLLCGCELVGSKNKIGSYLEYKEKGHEQFKSDCKMQQIFFGRL